MNVDITKMAAVLDFLRDLEKAKLPDIKWYHNGVQVIPEFAAIEGWKFTGLNNRDFFKEKVLADMPDGAPLDVAKVLAFKQFISSCKIGPGSTPS